jgi:hypothetical protein
MTTEFNITFMAHAEEEDQFILDIIAKSNGFEIHQTFGAYCSTTSNELAYNDINSLKKIIKNLNNDCLKKVYYKLYVGFCNDNILEFTADADKSMIYIYHYTETSFASRIDLPFLPNKNKLITFFESLVRILSQFKLTRDDSNVITLTSVSPPVPNSQYYLD